MRGSALFIEKRFACFIKYLIPVPLSKWQIQLDIYGKDMSVQISLIKFLVGLCLRKAHSKCPQLTWGESDFTGAAPLILLIFIKMDFRLHSSKQKTKENFAVWNRGDLKCKLFDVEVSLHLGALRKCVVCANQTYWGTVHQTGHNVSILINLKKKK